MLRSQSVCFHMLAKIAAIVAIVWKPGFNRFAITRINEVNVYVCFTHFVPHNLLGTNWSKVGTKDPWVRNDWIPQYQYPNPATSYTWNLSFTSLSNPLHYKIPF